MSFTQALPETRLIANQQQLWDAQHARRGVADGLEAQLADVPNDSAVLLGEMLSPSARVAEVGPANGRDARYWARQFGHFVHCLDFSGVALDQLAELAHKQGLTDLINPVRFDANTGRLPDQVGPIDAFYSRSALHIGDKTLKSLLSDVNERLTPGGMVLIEGKGPGDPKINRSVHVGDGLASDPMENGHLRRVWTPEVFTDICETFGWETLLL